MLGTQETQNCAHRCQTDVAVAKAVGIEPFFVKVETLRQHLADRLMQTCGQQPADAPVCHDAIVNHPHIAAAVLAGGKAQRFGGRDKSRLLIDGRTIIFRQLDVLQRVCHEIFIVAPDPGRYEDVSVPVYPDVVPASGAMGGLLTALERAHAPRVLVVACDLPFLHSGVLERLADAANDGDGAWVRSARGVEPLLACYRRAARVVVRGEILASRLKLATLDGVLRMTPVDAATLAEFGSIDRLLANVNTPAEYERIQ